MSISMLQGISPERYDQARAFGDEVAAFFAERRRPEWTRVHPASAEHRELGREMDLALVERGWYVLHWPRAYGGEDDLIRYAVLRELEGYFRVPSAAGHARFIIGPGLVRFGTPEQCERFLPRIAAGELVVCLGYTEPDAGSDLGAMRTTAERRGDEFVVNGSKMFITHGHYADMMLLAAVTDPEAPKYKNMSLFLIDMDQPGITVTPLLCLTGQRVNAVYFDDVHLPADAMVGTENRGFYNMAMALNFERSGLEKPARYMAELEDIADEARRTGAWERDAVREGVGRLAAHIDAWSAICWRVLDLQARGEVPSWEASMSELYRKDVNPAIGRLAFEVFGRRALLEHDDPDALLGGRLEWLVREGFNNHGQGGRFVTRNVIARRGLELGRPDPPRQTAGATGGDR